MHCVPVGVQSLCWAVCNDLSCVVIGDGWVVREMGERSWVLQEKLQEVDVI